MRCSTLRGTFCSLITLATPRQDWTGSNPSRREGGGCGFTLSRSRSCCAVRLVYTQISPGHIWTTLYIGPQYTAVTMRTWYSLRAKICSKGQWCQVSQYHSIEMLTALEGRRQKRQRSCQVKHYYSSKSGHVFSRGRNGRGHDLCLSLYAPSGLMCFFVLDQRFSNFFQVGTTFISQNVLRTTLLLGLSDSLGLP